MINSVPLLSSDLDELVQEARRQTAEVREILAALTPEALNWRPSPAKWSAGGHVAHMVIVNAPYHETIRTALAKARVKGWLGEGPYRHGWFGRWFAGSMEPPPKKRWKTSPKMVPDPVVEGGEVMAAFEGGQETIEALLEDARGVDLGRTRISSPFLKVVRFSVGAAFGILLAHNRRHIWLIRELMADEAFPS